MGKGAFQELDQVAAVQRFTKYSGRAKRASDIPGVIRAAVRASVAGRPGAAYVDIPSDVLMAPLSFSEVSTISIKAADLPAGWLRLDLTHRPDGLRLLSNHVGELCNQQGM